MTNSIESYRYEVVHGDDADFIAYQHTIRRRRLADGVRLDDPANRRSLGPENRAFASS